MRRASDSHARRVGYPTWNLLAVAVFVALALADVAQVVADHSRHPLPWLVIAVYTVGLVWGITSRHRRPSSLLPRLFLLVAVPAWLLITLTGDMTSFWVGAPWLLIVPALLTHGWVDRLFGAPRTD